MAIQETRHSATQFWELAQDAQSGSRIELIEGVIVEMPPSSAIPAIVALKIGRYIDDFVTDHQLGYVSGADAGFIIDEHTGLSPDAAYISKERLPALPDRFFPIPPDLAVEVVSPTDSIKAVQRKALLYLSHGTPLVWIVYLSEKSVDICTLGDDGGLLIHEVAADGVLDGGKVLPKLKISLSDVFPSS